MYRFKMLAKQEYSKTHLPNEVRLGFFDKNDLENIQLVMKGPSNTPY